MTDRLFLNDFTTLLLLPKILHQNILQRQLTDLPQFISHALCEDIRV